MRARAALAALAVIASVGVTTAAQAAPPPGATRVQANGNGWSGLSYKPGKLYTGNGCAPWLTNMSWATWTAGTATTRAGLLHQCGAGRPVSVYLHDELTHNGAHYFARMRWTWTARSGARRTEYWRFTPYCSAGSCGSVPSWNLS